MEKENNSRPIEAIEDKRVFYKYLFHRETTIRALKVAIIVAPILIAINHIDTIIRMQLDYSTVLKSLLTFIVPYSVSAYSSAKALSEKNSKSQTE